MQLSNRILFGLALGAGSGIAANVLARSAPWVQFVSDNIAGPVGQIFLRLLLMIVVPLVFASLTLGVVGLGDLRAVGRVGGKTLVYFFLSTTVATVIGLTLVNLVRPGHGTDSALRTELLETFRPQVETLQETVKPGIGMIVNIVPRNPVRAAADMDMLAIIFFSLAVGAALALLPAEKARPLIAVVDAIGEVVMKIIGFAMAFAPVGVFGLIFVVTARFGWDLLIQLGVYAAVVITGLVLHALGTLSAFVAILARRNPLWFWHRARASLITAFSTSSSNAALPTNIAVAETEMGVAPKVARFVLPLGATMNMNGTALYEGVTVLFLAQVFGVSLSLDQQVVVVVLSVVTAIGAAGVPGGSLPLLMVVLATVGVPPEGIAVILGIDRLLDMCRTTLNVAGDLSAAVVIHRSEAAEAAPDLPSDEPIAA